MKNRLQNSLSMGTWLPAWIRGSSLPYVFRKISLLTFLTFCFAVSHAQLNGVKTINPAGSGPNNYTSFTNAINDLIFQGVNGPVVFKVSPGNYNGQISIPYISGTNAFNTITFDGGFGNASVCVLEYPATTNFNAHVVKLDNCAWINLKNLTIRNTGGKAGLGINIYGGSNNCKIIRCNIYVDSTSGSSSFKAIQMTNSDDVYNGGLCGANEGDTYEITIDSCDISGGYYNFYGQSSRWWDFSNPYLLYMRANKLRNAWQCAIGISNLSGYQINYNVFDLNPGNNSSWGFSHCNGGTNGNQTYEMIGNRFYNCGQYGIYSLTRNNNGARGKIWNNFFRGDWRASDARALNLSYDNNFDIWHNTIVMQNALNNNGAGIWGSPAGWTTLDIRNNNIVVSNPASTGYTIYTESGCITYSDYNNLYKVNNALGEFLLVSNGAPLTQSNFRGFGGLDANSLTDNPNFPSASDPRPVALCIRGSYMFQLPVDINGNARLNPPTIGAAEGIGGNNYDIELSAFVRPVFPIASGTNDVEVTIKNKGFVTITKADVTVQIGATTKTIHWTGSLPSCSQTNVVFTGTNQFTINAGSNTAKAWTSIPNDENDEDTKNDTASITFCTPLPGGTYTIDPAGSGPNNYTSFTAVTGILNCGGVSGPVVFNVAAGTFTEKLSLLYVQGANATNTITFTGTGAGSTTLMYPGGNSSALVNISGTPYVTIEKMTLRSNTGVDQVALIRLAGRSDYCVIRNNAIEFSGYTQNTVFGINFGSVSTSSGGAESSGTIIENNTFNNTGYCGIWMQSGSSSAKNDDVVIRNNTFNNNFVVALNIQYGDNIVVSGNRITMGGYTYNQGISMNSVNNAIISENIIKNTGQYGLNLYGQNCQVYNNMLSDFNNCPYANGLFIQSSNNTKVYHNTVYFNPSAFDMFNNRAALSLYYSQNSDVRNNILVYDGVAAHGVLIEKQGGSGYFANIDNNQYWPGIADVYTEDWSTFYKSLADYRAYDPSNNSHSREELPVFINTSMGSVNAHLASSYDAPSGDNSLAFPINIDVDGDPRCAFGMTIGADQSSYPQIIPVATFVEPDSIYENSPVRIVNTSYGDPDRYGYTWYVDGSYAGSSRNLDYNFTTAGTYDVSLVVFGCSGSDSIGRTVKVVLPTSTPVTDFVADKQIVDMYSDIVNFRDASKFGPSIWDWVAEPRDFVFFIPGSNVQNPSAFFGEPGYFDICLTTGNNLGNGTQACKNSYIFVREEYAMCTDPSGTTKNRYGRLYDDGGPTGNYSDNRNCTFLIDPCASSVTLKFSQFALNFGDYLYIYDGTSSSDPLIGVYDNSIGGLPGGAAGVTASSGKMFIRWVTDGGSTSAGFAAAWSAVADGTPAPVADFDFPTTLYTDEDATFTSTSTGSNLQYIWDFEPPYGTPGYDGGDKATDRYSWSLSGTYNVKLRVVSCAGSSTITKTVNVIDPTSTPVVDFEADRLVVPVSAVVNFTNKTTGGATFYEWKINSPLGVTIKPSANSKNISASFLVPGTYEVKLIATNSFGSDSTTKTAYITVYNYCNPGVAATDGKTGISNVTFAGLNNSSTSGITAYTNYISDVMYAKVVKGASYPISISRTDVTDPMNRKVWIDWNIDGDFDDAGEEVASEPSAHTTTFTTTIRVPRTATEGRTRMRVGVSYSNQANKPCGWNGIGEFEDYTIEVNNDAVGPVITLNGPSVINVEQWYQYIEPGFSASDVIDGNLTPYVVISTTVDTTTVGTYQVKYEATDSSGNTTTVTRTVNVTPDVTNPTITLTGASTVTHTVKTPYIDAGALVKDYFNRTLPTPSPTSTVNVNKVGSYSVTYEATDLAGNKAIISRTVNVVDDVAPVITKTGSDTVYVEVLNPYTEPGVSATDNYDASVNVNANSISTNKTGRFTITYTATDTAGNTTQETRTVIVRDTQAPEIEINGLDTVIIDVYSRYFEDGAMVTDAYCQGLAATATGVVNTNHLGDYTVTYSAKDCEGNAATTKTRLVRVVDREAPKLLLKGFNTTTRIQRWTPYTDAGVSYKDNYYSQAVLADSLKISSNVNTSWEGIYEYCYDMTDPSGNIADRVCRQVEVISNTTGIEGNYLENAVNIYPNPTKGQVNVNVKFDQERTVKITVMNTLGQVVATLDAKTAAEHNYAIDLSSFAAGMYMVRVESGDMSVLRKITLVN